MLSVSVLIFYQLGYIKVNLTKVENRIAGTGSMYPTFPKANVIAGEDIESIVATPVMNEYPNGIEVFGNRYFKHELQRGDIVAFETKVTKEISKKIYGKESGYVKRIIGLPNETIRLFKGQVYINGKVLEEPYIANFGSTYGKSFLDDCEELTIPDSKYFVMGDNRKSSIDSRAEIGFVDESEIENFLSLKEQQEFNLDQEWRSPTDTKQTSAYDYEINPQEYINKLNIIRTQFNQPAMQLNDKLIKSAEIRAKEIMENPKANPSEEQKQESTKQSIRESGYINSIFGETYTFGAYTEEELLEAFYTNRDKDILFSNTYSDVGIYQLNTEVNGCPKTILVQHFGGYKQPELTPEYTQTIEERLRQLIEVEPSWESLFASTIYPYNKQDIDRINEIIDIRISKLEEILNNIRVNDTLTKAQYLYWINEDGELQLEQNELSKKINSLAS